MVPRLIDSGSARQVGFVGSVFQFPVQIVVERRHESAFNTGIRRIEARGLTGCIRVCAFEARIVPAEYRALIAQQLLAESCRIDTQVRFFDVGNGGSPV